MLDLTFIRERFDEVKKACVDKNLKIDIDRVLDMDSNLRSKIHQIEILRARKNSLTTEFPLAKNNEEKTQLKNKVLEIKKDLATIEIEKDKLKTNLQNLLYQIPNIPWNGSPIGDSDNYNIVIRKEGVIPSFSFEVKDHVELIEQNEWADFSRIVNVCGSRTYALKGRLALLEQALLLFTSQQMNKKGFTALSLPSIARENAFIATGHFPSSREDVFELQKDELFLTGTAEVVLTSLHSNEILSYEDLPIKYSGTSPCFRREAGSAGRDVRGLMRVHQFNKVEQFIIAEADEEISQELHKELIENSEYLMKKLGLPYQILECCTGDMGPGKFRQNDIEAWIPSFNGYRETHSCSSLLDWQSRRANLRYRDKKGRVRFAYTLNNTAIATPRIFVSLLENYQTEDGRVIIPECLRVYFDGDIYL